MNIEIRVTATPEDVIAILKNLNIDASSLVVNMVQDENAKFDKLNDADRVLIIKKEVSRVYSVTIDAIDSRTRKRDATDARHTAIYFTSVYTGLSLKKIGLNYGGRDHSSVIHATQKYDDLYGKNKTFTSLSDIVKASLDNIFNPKKENKFILES